jgi:hypothetical protein
MYVQLSVQLTRKEFFQMCTAVEKRVLPDVYSCREKGSSRGVHRPKKGFFQRCTADEKRVLPDVYS